MSIDCSDSTAVMSASDEYCDSGSYVGPSTCVSSAIASSCSFLFLRSFGNGAIAATVSTKASKSAWLDP